MEAAAKMDYCDIRCIATNQERLTDFCGWPVMIGDIIPINLDVLPTVFPEFSTYVAAVQHGS